MIEIVAFLIALATAISVHEFAHAFAADRLGDPTPRSQGRLTLNPLAHIDPLGTLMLLFFRIGWGKPVQFDPYNLSNPRRDAAIISIAGPTTNILTAILISLVTRFLPIPAELAAIPYMLIIINVSLAVFNLIPIFPLDGEKILAGILPRDMAYEYQAIMSRYGTLILILMIIPLFGSSPVQALILPIIQFVTRLLL